MEQKTSFTVAAKNTEYLRTNLTRNIQDEYKENLVHHQSNIANKRENGLFRTWYRDKLDNVLWKKYICKF